jgi:hypothetical protein
MRALLDRFRAAAIDSDDGRRMSFEARRAEAPCAAKKFMHWMRARL